MLNYLEDGVGLEEIARNEQDQEVEVLASVSLEVHQSLLEKLVEFVSELLRTNSCLQKLETETIFQLAGFVVVQNVNHQLVVKELLVTALNTQMVGVDESLGWSLLSFGGSHHPQVPMCVKRGVEVAEQKRDEGGVKKGNVIHLGVLEEGEEVGSRNEEEERAFEVIFHLVCLVIVEDSLIEPEVDLCSSQGEKEEKELLLNRIVYVNQEVNRVGELLQLEDDQENLERA